MRKSGFLAVPASYMSQSLCEIGEDGGSKAIITAKIGHKRPKPKIIYRKTESSDEEENFSLKGRIFLQFIGNMGLHGNQYSVEPFFFQKKPLLLSLNLYNGWQSRPRD